MGGLATSKKLAIITLLILTISAMKLAFKRRLDMIIFKKTKKILKKVVRYVGNFIILVILETVYDIALNIFISCNLPINKYLLPKATQ